MLSTYLQNEIERSLSERYGLSIFIKGISPVSGGSINSAYKLDTTKGTYFLKTNSNDYFDNFKAESFGLKLLASKTQSLYIPEIIDCQVNDLGAYLLMEFIESGVKTDTFWENFGKALADLHICKSNQFGLYQSNFIGSLPQSNKFHNTWTGFFIEERIRPLLRNAYDKGLLAEKYLVKFKAFEKQVANIFPKEEPSLLHGDLWSGNFMAAKGDKPSIFDPAVYYGHREMDMAMTTLFGGFPPLFYKTYHEHYPMEKGFEDRFEICNLYPLLVHLLLFGGGYKGQVERVLERF